MKFTKWTSLRLLALVLTVAFVWCLNWDRLSLKNWSVPIDYYEDSPMALTFIKSAADGEWVPFLSKNVSRLGAPYTGNWNDWPVWGDEVFFPSGLVARGIGLFAAANLAVLLGYVTSALAFYACCRWLRFRRLWSFVGAVLFAFTYYHSYRSLHHLTFTYSYTIPFGILSCWLIAFSKRLRWGNGPAWICLVTAAIMGLSSPYNVNMFGQLLCLSLGVQWLTRRRKANLQIGLFSLGLVVVCFVAMNLRTLAYRAANGKNPDALIRGYYETELFALKPIELFMPPLTHKVIAVRDMSSKYVREAWIRGELFSPYLGVVGITGLIWMFAEGLLRLLKPRKFKWRGRFPAHVPLVLWILFYSVVGGLNCMIALASVPLFRGSNRYSIFVSALVLLFLVSRATLLTRRWQAEKKFAVAAAILFVGLLDQLPQMTPREETQSIAHDIEVDHAFVNAMETKLPANAMVFQLPVMPFPESTAVNNLQAYEHLRPYLSSKTLRFSFGSNKGRPREDWQKDVEKMPASQMISTLEKYGFAAIYLNRKGFSDQAEGLLKQFAAAGRSQFIEDDSHEQVCILLNPSAAPVLPPAGTRAPLIFQRGWGNTPSPAGTQYWAGGDASVSFFNPPKLSATSYSLNCQIACLSPRRASIVLNGKEIWGAELSPGRLVQVNLRIDAKPRYNRLEFKSDVRDHPSKQNPVPRAFVVVNPQVLRLE